MNLFDSGLHQEKVSLASAKADLASLPEHKNFLVVAQKQLLELPLRVILYQFGDSCTSIYLLTNFVKSL
ncbi:MAG: hypothetical protein FVQ80_06410 [Planctomycetes bacterium]|nr:hypothetical protein [Planctomycetota bacterium]